MTSGSLMRLSPALPAPRGQAGTGRHCPRRSHRHRGGPAGAEGARGGSCLGPGRGLCGYHPLCHWHPARASPAPTGPCGRFPVLPRVPAGTGEWWLGGSAAPRPLLPPRGAQGVEGRGPGASPLRGRPEPGHTGPSRAVPCRPSPGVRGALCPPSGPRPCPAAGLAAQRSGPCCPSRSPRRFTPARNAAQRPARGCRGAGCLCIFKYTALLGLRNNGDQ